MCDSRWKSGLRAVLLSTCLMYGVHCWSADEELCPDKDAPTAATPAAVRQRAQSIDEMRQLLIDSDTSTRYAALDAMLRSCDSAMKEVAYEAGFGSPDRSMKALALKYKLLNMRRIILEMVPPEAKFSQPQQQFIDCCAKINIDNLKRNFATGDFSGGNTIGNVSGLELHVTIHDIGARLRLDDNGTLVGTMTRGAVTMPARVSLR